MFVGWTLHSISGGKVSFCFGEQHVGWFAHLKEGKRFYLPDAALISLGLNYGVSGHGRIYGRCCKGQ